MSPSPSPEGPLAVAGAPNLPAGFTETFTSHYIDAGEVRLHAVVGGEGLAGSPRDLSRAASGAVPNHNVRRRS